MKLSALINRPVGFNAPALVASKRLQAVSDRIIARWPDVVKEPPEKDRDKLVAEMKRRLEEKDWRDLPTSFVTRAARALFDRERRDRSDLSDLRTFYINELLVSTHSSFLSAMASVYISSFEPNAAHTRMLATALQSARKRLGGRWSKLETLLPNWLDPAEAPKSIANLMVRARDPWTELKSIGLTSPHAPGLMDHAHLSYVDFVRPHLRNMDDLQVLIGWLRPEGQQPRMSGAAEAICAILGHWLSVDPPQDDQRYIVESLVSLYGDPRVSASGAWSGVPEEHRAVILRWLTGENIRFFLDVVSAVEESHMWAPRRKFWLSLHKEGRIDGAWVAFSREAEIYALRQAAKRSGQTMLRFGKQTASRGNTSLLVLKIGNKIVVEGSHNYKVHVFPASAKAAPTLYQSEYDCEKIRRTLGAKSKPHLGDWQSWVREQI